MKKFKYLVFIDDHYPTNFYHRTIAREAEIADNMTFFEDPMEALRHLKEIGEEDLKPEIIFLDINMPEVNGWEFTELYKQNIGHTSSKIIILTTSSDPADKERAQKNDFIHDFMSKPLSVDLFNHLRDRFLN